MAEMERALAVATGRDELAHGSLRIWDAIAISVSVLAPGMAMLLNTSAVAGVSGGSTPLAFLLGGVACLALVDAACCGRLAGPGHRRGDVAARQAPRRHRQDRLDPRRGGWRRRRDAGPVTGLPRPASRPEQLRDPVARQAGLRWPSRQPDKPWPAPCGGRGSAFHDPGPKPVISRTCGSTALMWCRWRRRSSTVATRTGPRCARPTLTGFAKHGTSSTRSGSTGYTQNGISTCSSPVVPEASPQAAAGRPGVVTSGPREPRRGDSRPRARCSAASAR